MKKYMVMECRLSYAVVLDNEGHFLKVANRHYEVGQTVTDVIEMQIPQSSTRKKIISKPMYILAAVAACMVLILTSVFQMGKMKFASVYMTINPEVRIDVNRWDTVVELDGVNADGDDLIFGYDYKKKDLDLVVNELVDRAIEMGYLHEGGQIFLALDAKNDDWIISRTETLNESLNEYVREKLSVTIEVVDKKSQSNRVVIPIIPDKSDYGDSDYDEETTKAPMPAISETVYVTNSDDIDDSNYGPNNNSLTDYDDTDYGSNNDGVTDYDDTDYGPNNDGVTDYDDTDYGSNNDGVTDYDDTDYGPNNDDVTDYDDTDHGSNNDDVTDYDDTDYGSNNDGVTDYDDTDYESNNDVITDYDDTDYGPNNDGVTVYDDSEYVPNNDSVNDYDDSDYVPRNDGAIDYDDSDFGYNYDDGDSSYFSDYDD